MVGIPSPKFDTHRITEILRRLKRQQIKTQDGAPYRRVYIKGKLNTLNTLASVELGAGAYTIKPFCYGWYYIGLKDVVEPTGRGWKKGVERGKKEVVAAPPPLPII